MGKQVVLPLVLLVCWGFLTPSHAQQLSGSTLRASMSPSLSLPQAKQATTPQDSPLKLSMSKSLTQAEEFHGLTSVAVVAPVVVRASSDSPWRIQKSDKRLDVSLSRWAKNAGIALQWDADRYLMIEADTEFVGGFEQAISQLLNSPGILNSEYPLQACLYNNTPPLLRITRLGDQSGGCQ